MALLVLIFNFVLHIKAVRNFKPAQERKYPSISADSLYYRVGHDAIVPCAGASSSVTTCSVVKWYYSKDPSSSQLEVWKGTVIKSSVRAARLKLNNNCSLLISSITAEDAGAYTCVQCMYQSLPCLDERRDPDRDEVKYLSALTISPSPPDTDPERDGQVTLECSLERYRGLGPCQENSVRWVNETGAVLLGEGVGYKFIRRTNCVSVLTVKHQSGHNRKYTCQFVDEENNVKIQADYTPAFTEPTESTESTVSTHWSPPSSFMWTLRVAGLILMIVITVLFIQLTGIKKSLQDLCNNGDDGEDTVYYVHV